MILFDESKHIYWNDKTGEQYDSVTTILSKYKNPFDTDKVASQYALNHPELGMNKEQVIKKWEDIKTEALRKGNKFHFQQEMESLYMETKLSRNYNDSIEDLSKLPNGTYPELRLFYDPYKLAGTADKVIIIRPYAYIYDYKTNKRILSKIGFKNRMMLDLLDFLPDAEFYHYEMQLNIYAWILWKAGFIPKDLTIIHKRFLNNEPIPEENFVPFVSRKKQEEELKKVSIYNYEFYKNRTTSFLRNDWTKRDRQRRNLFGVS